MRVLIVDDSRFIREHLRQWLERMEVSCAEAKDGTEALEVLRGGEAFDCMLLDVNMPKMSGLECVKALRQARLQPGMKVMMVTTEEDHALIARALENGADEFLMKPFTPESLRDKLRIMELAA